MTPPPYLEENVSKWRRACPQFGEPFATCGAIWGVVQNTKSLLEVNKVHGFDCQSCAWPNPNEHRKVAEFCENGAKAIADQATFYTSGKLTNDPAYLYQLFVREFGTNRRKRP